MKVKLNGEEFEFDPRTVMMSEAIAFEEQTGVRYAEWESDISQGTLRGLCGLAWLIWHRNGREVSFSDIQCGKADFDIAELSISLQKAKAELEKAASNPTQAVPRTGSGGTASRHAGTRRS